MLPERRRRPSPWRGAADANACASARWSIPEDWLIIFDMRQAYPPTTPMEHWIDNVNIESVHSGEVNP
jgi:hypothetical protein